MTFSGKTVKKEANSIEFKRFKNINETNSYRWTCGINAILSLSRELGISIYRLGIEPNNIKYILSSPKSEKQDTLCLIC